MAFTPEREKKWASQMKESQEGNAAQYEILLTDVTGILRPYLMKRVGDPNLAEDILQEVLMSIHRARHTFDPQRRFTPWMFAITQHRLVDYFRRWGRTIKKESGNLALIESLSEPATSEDKGLSEDLHNAVQELPEKQRQAVKLLKIQGLSVREAAIKMKMSEGAIKVNAHRGYRSLRKKLEEKNANR